MSDEAQAGREPPSKKPRKAVPVAKLAPSAQPGVQVEFEVDGPEPWLPRTLRKGLTASLIGHVILLVILALWTITYHLQGVKVIDTRLGGGSLSGSDLGDQLKGGLGMDEPLAFPAAAPEPTLESKPALASLTSIANLESLLPPATDRNPAENGGDGVALKGTGQAGAGDGFGVARFGSGTENIQGVDVKVGDPQFTLIWEGKADIDLHVLEPGGSHIFWPDEFRHGKQGGELDVDDRNGPGPENIYWVQGKGPAGLYKWYVEYYSPAQFEDFAGPVRWRVRIKHLGKTSEFRGVLKNLKERSRTYTLTLDEKDRIK